MQDEGLAELRGNVFLETPEYAVESQNLDVFFTDTNIDKLHFSKSVVFLDKDEDNTKVFGDNAIYDIKKNEIFIYGNVYSSSSKKDLKIQAESFTYNTDTKRGNLKRGKNKQIQIELNV